MTFAMQDLPGEFTSFDFPSGVPAPFNMAAAILSNTKMLTVEEKIKMVPGLLPMLTEGQPFIDRQARAPGPTRTWLACTCKAKP